jgi:hypothetical protein
MARKRRGRQYYSRWYDYYLRQLIELSLTVYKWDGLPETVDPRFLEKQLMEYGKIVFVNSPTLGYVTLQVTETGRIDQYYTPTERYAIAPNLMKLADIKFDTTDSVMIYNNYQRVPDLPSLQLFAEELADNRATMHVNVQAQKMPKVFTTNDKKKLSAMNVVSQMDQFEPVIIADGELGLGQSDVMDTSSAYVVDKLDAHQKNIWNEAMTFLSINNGNQDKKERVQTAEVNANDSQVITMGLARLKARQDAAERINKMFDLHISCTLREQDYQKENGGDEDGNVHSGTSQTD